jgi:aminomethyltransferase
MADPSPATPRPSPLDALHRALGGRMVPFAGWSLPVQYPAGIIAEHRQCRERAALFDVSHMGQLRLPLAALPALERLVPSSLASLPAGQARYTVLTNEAGGILDDLIVTHGGDHLFVVVNAARAEVDVAHLRAALGADAVEVLAERALLALQGPAAAAVLAGLAPAAGKLRFMQSTPAAIDGVEARISRLGYTGEDGFELSLPAAAAEPVARRLLAHELAGPAGLGARDSLRLEAGLCLYGADLDEGTSPIEAQLAWLVPQRRRAAGDFPGAARILAELADGPARKLVGIRPEGRAPARGGTAILDEAGAAAGEVTSGGFGPTVDGPIAMGYVRAGLAAPGTPLALMVRGKPLPARVVPLPFTPHRYQR